MIETLNLTIAKEAKSSQSGALNIAHSKSENGLEGKFRELFQSFNSESENPKKLETHQEQPDQSSDVSGAMSSDLVEVKNVDLDKFIGRKSHYKTERGSAEMEEANASKSGHQEARDFRDLDSKNEFAEVQELRKEITKAGTDLEPEAEMEAEMEVKPGMEVKPEMEAEPEGKTIQSKNIQPHLDTNRTDENSTSKHSTAVDNNRESLSEIKESLSDSALRVDRSSFEKSETDHKVDISESQSALKGQPQDEAQRIRESAGTIAFKTDRADQTNRIESSTAKYEPAVGHTEKSETDHKVDISESQSALKGQPQDETQRIRESAGTIAFKTDRVDQTNRIESSTAKYEPAVGHTEKSEIGFSKSESTDIHRVIKVDESSTVIPKSVEGDGKALQHQGPTAEMETSVSSSDQMKQVSSNEINSSIDLRGDDVDTQRGQIGEFIRENVHSSQRVAKSVPAFTTLNSSEARQNSESAEKFVDRVVNENVEKPIRIAQKPVEATVLIQDKVEPKRERNDVPFLNNNESKEISRITIPGIGLEATKQSISFTSRQGSENFGDLSESEKNETLWKEHTAELTESDDLNRSELSAAALSKLGDSTLSNHFLRKVLLPGLTQTVLTASGQSDRAESWQRHNFILEDGSKVQLSARKVDGVLHIKLGASIGELSKLLQIHQDEIREHLEKECNIKIDLQFDQGSGDQDQSSLDNFFGEATKKSVFDGEKEVVHQSAKNVKKQIHTVVTRNFGYNSKEWTA